MAELKTKLQAYLAAAKEEEEQEEEQEEEEEYDRDGWQREVDNNISYLMEHISQLESEAAELQQKKGEKDHNMWFKTGKNVDELFEHVGQLESESSGKVEEGHLKALIAQGACKAKAEWVKSTRDSHLFVLWDQQQPWLTVEGLACLKTHAALVITSCFMGC